MPSRTDPYPYDFKLGDASYLAPPARVMQVINDSWYRRRSLPWFPERQQSDAVTESLFPPKSEAAITVRDRSMGFGWSDPPSLGDDLEEPTRVYAWSGPVDAGTAGVGQGVDCSNEGIAMLGPLLQTAPLSDHGFPATPARGGGFWELSVGGTRYLYYTYNQGMWRTSNGTTWSRVQADSQDLPAAPSDRVSVFQGAQALPQAYFAFGPGSGYFRTWNGNPATGFGNPVSTASDVNQPVSLIVDGSAMWGLWQDESSAAGGWRVSKFYDGVESGVTTADPSWMLSIAVADGNDVGQHLLQAHDRLYIGFDQSLRTIADDRDTLHQTLWRTVRSAVDYNFRTWVEWRGELWFVANQGLYRLVPDRSGGVTLHAVGPEALPTNRTPVHGVVTALAADDTFVYAFLLDNTSALVPHIWQTYLVKYRQYDTKDGPTIRGHVVSLISYATTFEHPVHATVSTQVGTNPTLFVHPINAAGDMGSIILPRAGVYPPNDPNYKFCEKGYLYESRQHGGMYWVPKLFFGATLRAQDLSATETITPYYRETASGEFRQIGGRAVAVDPGARRAVDPPEEVQWWEARLKFERGPSTSATPKLLSATYHHALRPPARGYFQVFAHVADYLGARSQLSDRRTAFDIETALIALDSSPEPQTFVNRRGVETQVLIDEVDITTIEVKDNDQLTYETVARITMTELGAD